MFNWEKHMGFESEEIRNYLEHVNKRDFEKNLIKNFDKNVLLAVVLGVFILISIFLFDITITSRVGFVLVLIPLFYILVVAIEISHNMAVSAMKSEQLVRLNIALLETPVAKTTSAK